MKRVANFPYGLTAPWLAHCEALKVAVSDVQALAGQRQILEAYLLLQERLAGTGTGATRLWFPAGAPFARLAAAETSDPAAGPLPALQGAAAGEPALSVPSDAPTVGAAGVASALAQRGRPALVVVKCRPLVVSLVGAAIVQRQAFSKQVFVWKAYAGGASNA